MAHILKHLDANAGVPKTFIMKTYGICLLVAATILGCNGSDGANTDATCSPCGDGAIQCTGTVQECAAAGTCTTKIGATGAAVLSLDRDGTYSEVSTEGTQGGTWTEEVVGSDPAILLHTSAGPTALLSVYAAGACPY
jgi:hypothetical protein